MKYSLKSAFLALISGLTLFLFSCSNDSNNARIQVSLTDSPGDYEEVNIDIQQVQVNSSTSNSGWISLDIKKGVYNLRDLTNGIDTVLGSAELSSGKIEQIRLILGANNSLNVDGKTYDLSTPSAQQSGLKLNLHADLVEGITYKILLDFDAARSIVVHGNGTYSLKPVIRAIDEATSGAIQGTASPVAAMPAVFAISGADTVATAMADTLSGKFLLRGVPAGTYTISLVPATGYAGQQKTGVTVTLGNITDLGTIVF